MTKTIIDLTHTIEAKMPVYPGTEQPVIEVPCTFEEFGFQESKVQMFTHTGTHIDTPRHITDNGLTTESLPIETFIGKGLVLDYSHIISGQRIQLEKAHELIDIIVEGEIEYLLIYTGWAKYWGLNSYFYDFPVLSKEFALWLANTPIKGIGLDVISIDPTGDESLENHKIILENEIVIVENINNMEKLIGKQFTFVAAPLKLKNGDGSPVRAFAIMK